VYHPANPVAEPLPSSMEDEDIVTRLPIAATLPAGMPVSKYFRTLLEEEFMTNTSVVPGKDDEASDPIFASFAQDSVTVSKQELIARRRRKATTVGKARVDIDESVPESTTKEICSEDVQDYDENAGDTADGLPTPSQSHESEEERLARVQEGKLAALGVTGFAKPIRALLGKSTVSNESVVPEEEENPAAHGWNIDVDAR
jgi:hypothetical protein